MDLHFLRVICLICFVFSRGSSAVDPETGYGTLYLEPDPEYCASFDIKNVEEKL